MFYAFGHGKNIRLICFIYKFGIYVDADRHISFILVSFFYGLSNLPLLLQIISFLGKIRQLLRIHFYIIIQCDLICRFCKLFYAVQYLFYLCLVAGIKSNLNLIVSRYQIQASGLIGSPTLPRMRSEDRSKPAGMSAPHFIMVRISVGAV